MKALAISKGMTNSFVKLYTKDQNTYISNCNNNSSAFTTLSSIQKGLNMH